MEFTARVKKYLKSNISAGRYAHTLNVERLAVKIAKKYGIKDIEKIRAAALLHDCEKNPETGLSHSAASSETAKKVFGVKDKKILNAVRNHTFGSRDMDEFSKIIYIADISEPGRKFPAAKKIRRLAFKNLDEAMLFALSEKIKYVVSKKEPLSVESVKLYNELAKPVKFKK